MPTLKGLSCQLQWADTNTPFQEYATIYGDGVVETYIVVPDKPQPFNIRLTSKGFIFEGLAVAVFIDGTYQCNRNRVNLIPAKKGIPRERTEIDFVMRQKEKAIGDGTYMGRQWRFDDHNIVPDAPKKSEGDHFYKLGEIEILVMRCRARDSDDTNASTVSSAAESRILETAAGESRSPSAEDDRQSLSRDTSVEPPKTDSASANEGGGLMMGIFDGAADYPPGPPYHDRALPHYWAQRPPGQPSNAQEYWCPDEYVLRYGPSPLDNTYPVQMPSRPSAPPGGLPPKRVHFDFGHSYRREPPPPPPPTDWDDRYSDRINGQHRPNPPGYAPGLSESPQAYWNTQGPPTSASGPGGLPNMPPASHTQRDRNNHPLNHQSPQYYQFSPHPAKFPPQAAPPFPPYLPYRWQAFPTPYVSASSATWPPRPQNLSESQGPYPFAGKRNSSDSAVSPKSHPQKPATGSLDPAKDENNSQDEREQSNHEDGDNNDWQNSGNGNTNADWEKSNENNTKCDQQSNGNNTNTNTGDKSCCGDRNQITSWDQSNTTNNQQATGGDTGWGSSNGPSNNNTNNVTTAPANNNWDAQPSTTTAAATLTSPGARPLYGPHGAYYAAQNMAANDVPCDAEEEPRYDVPQSYVDEYGSRKQVQPGRGYLYTKQRCSPEYVDSLQEPYARFVFQYRTKEEIKRERNIDIEVEPSGDEEAQKFQEVSKDELIRMLLRAKGALGGKIPSPPPEATSPRNAKVSPFDPVAVEPPDISHLDFDLPQRSDGGGGGGDKAKDDGWTNQPAGQWSATTNDMNTGGTKWTEQNANQSTNLDQPWCNSDNADSFQTAPKSNGDKWNSDNNNENNNVNGKDIGTTSEDWGKSNNDTGAITSGTNNNNTSGDWDGKNNDSGQASLENDVSSGRKDRDGSDGANNRESSREAPSADLITDPNQDSNQQTGTSNIAQPQPDTMTHGGWVPDGQGGWYWPFNAFSVQQTPIYDGFGQPTAYYIPSHEYLQPQHPSTRPPAEHRQTQAEQHAPEHTQNHRPRNNKQRHQPESLPPPSNKFSENTHHQNQAQPKTSQNSSQRQSQQRGSSSSGRANAKIQGGGSSATNSRARNAQTKNQAQSRVRAQAEGEAPRPRHGW